MSDEATCGTGMAAQSVLPRRLAALADATANVLTGHLRSLDPAEPDAAAEREAWQAIADDHREIANRLRAVADRMAATRDLPLADHDMAVLADERSTAEFEAYVDAHRELLTLLQEAADVNEEMLAAIRDEAQQ